MATPRPIEVFNASAKKALETYQKRMKRTVEAFEKANKPALVAYNKAMSNARDVFTQSMIEREEQNGENEVTEGHACPEAGATKKGAG